MLHGWRRCVVVKEQETDHTQQEEHSSPTLTNDITMTSPLYSQHRRCYLGVCARQSDHGTEDGHQGHLAVLPEQNCPEGAAQRQPQGPQNTAHGNQEGVLYHTGPLRELCNDDVIHSATVQP